MSEKKRETVIVSAARTPFGKFGKGLKSLQATDLGGLAIKEALSRAGISGDQVDEVIYGNVISAGEGQIPARQASVKGGVPYSVPVFHVNKVCGSALKAVTLADQIIRVGDADVIVAGGMESMSNAPYLDYQQRWGSRMNNVKMVDAMVYDGLTCPINQVHMGVYGGVVAVKKGITREMQDEWALRSHQRWMQAEKEGFFNEERFPVEIKDKKGNVTVVDKDESPRADTTLEALQKLPVLFTKENTVTAGNAPGVNDGASAVVLMSREKAEELGVPILATIKGSAQASTEVEYITTVPGLSIQKLLEKTGHKLEDIDEFEINEAFASVPLVSGIDVLGMSPEEVDAKVNLNGGAVACGHPIGATGARILMTLIFDMKRRGHKLGIATLCSGMAQGDAILVEV